MDQVAKIYEALEERLQSRMGAMVKTWLRQPARPDQCPSQPALILLEADGTQDFDDGGAPDMTSLGADVTVYLKAEGKWPGEKALGLVRAIRRALRWSPADDPEPGDGYSTTLGGKVLYARVVAWDLYQQPAELSQWGVSIEIEMLAPDVDSDDEP